MRQRRPSLLTSTNDDDIKISHISSPQKSPEVRTSPSKKSAQSNSIAIISGVVGFVVSTWVLLSLWSMYQNNSRSDSLYEAYLDGKEQGIHWDWSRYSGPFDKNTQSTNPEPRYLIVQIAPDGESKHLQDALDITSRVNRAYAKKLKLDYAIATLPEIHAADGSTDIQYYIKILYELLTIGFSKKSETSEDGDELAVNQATTQYPYDFVWIFKDPSMIPVDFESNIFEDYTEFLLTSLGQNNNVGLNDEALLWNLHHPHIFMLLSSWAMLGNLGHALSKTGQTSEQPLWSEVIDDASMFYHFPSNAQSDLSIADDMMEEESNQAHLNVTDSPSAALIKLKSVADLICFRYFPSCDVL